MKKQLLTADVCGLLEAVGDAAMGAGEELARLDGALGDGDMGVTVTLAFRAAKKLMKKNTYADTQTLLVSVAERIGEEAPSTFGTLLATMLRGASQHAGETVGSRQYADMLAGAGQAVMERGKASRGDKTLLDALLPAAEAAADAAGRQAPLSECAEAAARAGEAGADETKGMRAAIGRAGYMGERTVGVKDPGAAAVAIMLRAAADYMAAD